MASETITRNDLTNILNEVLPPMAFVLLQSSISVSLGGNGSVIKTLTECGITVPSGYDIVSVTPIVTGSSSTGSAMTKVMGNEGSVEDSAVAIGVRNLSTASVTWTVKVKVLIMKQ